MTPRTSGAACRPLPCPHCGGADSIVTAQNRLPRLASAIRTDRQCCSCNNTFSTFEVLAFYNNAQRFHDLLH